VFLFGAVCVIATFYSLKAVVREQALKVKYRKGLCKSDIDFTRGNVLRLVLFSFLGGWVSGALGLGGGAIFNPLLLSMGVAPSVASSTGMFMIIFSTLGSSVSYIASGMLNVTFAAWIGGWCALGSIAGMYVLGWVMKKYNRQSPIVFLLTLIFIISVLLVPVFGIIDLFKDINNGRGDTIL
jgi:uncharacterized membrane protein YfcA